MDWKLPLSSLMRRNFGSVGCSTTLVRMRVRVAHAARATCGGFCCRSDVLVGVYEVN